mmetsp:Transcript_1371/g.3171  ORF Transcript_1371/g.3171 Transcript_1371/m.3171 type:complete len:202 (+) Transcript_1371:540-1145(+)
MITNRKFRLIASIVENGFDNRRRNNVRQEGYVVQDECQGSRTADPPLDGLQNVLFHVGKFHFRVAAPAQIRQQRGFHLERFVQFDGYIQTRHGHQLIFLSISKCFLSLLGAHVTIEIRHADAHGFAPKLAKVDDLVAPFAHFHSAIFVHRFCGFPPNGLVGRQVVVTAVFILFLDQHHRYPIRNIVHDVIRKDRVFYIADI